MVDLPELRATDLALQDPLDAHPCGNPALHLIGGKVWPTRSDDCAGVFLGLQESWQDSGIPVVHPDGAALEVDHWREVARPGLPGYQFLQVGEGAGEVEDLIALLGEVRRWLLLLTFKMTDEAVAKAKLVRKFYLRQTVLLPPGPELAGEFRHCGHLRRCRLLFDLDCHHFDLAYDNVANELIVAHFGGE